MGLLTERHANGWDFFFSLSDRWKAVVVAFFVVPVLIFVFMIARHRGHAEDGMRAEMLEECVPEHGEATCAEWLDAHHEECFDRNYSSNGRTQTSVADQPNYDYCVQHGVEAMLEKKREDRDRRYR